MAGALEAWREAIRLQPDYAPAHSDLGAALLEIGDLDDAITAALEAIRLDPGSPEDYCNLGRALCRQGRYQEALPHLKRGHELGKRLPGRESPSAAWIASCARSAELEALLPDLLAGAARPRNAAERAVVARICFRKGLYAESLRLFGEALAEEPRLLADARNAAGYNAAKAAVKAGERARALDWLRADLSAASRLDRRTVALILVPWKRDPDLAAVRDRIDELPEAEREGWRKLWADVDALLAPGGR
jgi:hypothetical protein